MARSHCSRQAWQQEQGTEDSLLEPRGQSRESNWERHVTGKPQYPLPSDVIPPTRPPKLPQTAPPAWDQAFKCTRLWGEHLIQLAGISVCIYGERSKVDTGCTFSSALSLNLELTNELDGLPGEFEGSMSLWTLRCWGYKHILACLAFLWVLGTQVLMPAQQTFLQLSHLPSPRLLGL